MTAKNKENFLRLQSVSKSYGATRALNAVDLEVSLGSVHAILGENGAGKSTLMKSLVGVVQPDEGIIEIAGTRVTINNPVQAASLGIVCVFQELSLIPHLTVAQNITLTNPPLTQFGFISKSRSRRRAFDILTRMGCEGIDPDDRCGELPLTKQQLVEIAKALYQKPKLLILDEATSALSAEDVTRFFSILRRLRDEGRAILFISHRMHEIDEIADECSVFRNGEHVETFDVGTRTDDERIQLIIGRPIHQVYPPKPEFDPSGKPRLSVKGLSWQNRLHDISLEVKPGEICGLGGLDGQGQNEFLLALFGVLKGVRGEVLLDGKPLKMASPRSAKSPGQDIALIPESRKSEGLFLDMSVAHNMSITGLETFSKFSFLDHSAEQANLRDLAEKLQIKAPNLQDPVSTLSGGNQQKVLLAKWIALSPQLLLLNDPTRGVDIGTKQQIYSLLRELADQDMSIILYATDYDELIGLCDRIHVFYEGRTIKKLSGDEITETNILHSALGGKSERAKAEPAISLKELKEIYQVREALEISGIQSALDSDDFTMLIDDMKSALAKMKDASSNNNKAEYAKHDTKFHRIILKMSGNETLLTIWDSLEIQKRVLHTMLGTPISVDNAFKLHAPIVAAVEQKNAQLASSKIIDHYTFIRKYHEKRLS